MSTLDRRDRVRDKMAKSQGSEILFYLMAEEIVQKMPLFSGRYLSLPRERGPSRMTLHRSGRGHDLAVLCNAGN